MIKVLKYLASLVSLAPVSLVSSCVPIISNNPNIKDLHSFDLDFSNPKEFGGWEEIKKNYQQEIDKTQVKLEKLELEIKNDTNTSDELKEFMFQTTVYMTKMQISVWKCIVSEAEFNLSKKLDKDKSHFQSQLEQTIAFINEWKFIKSDKLTEEEKIMSKWDVEIWTRIQAKLKSKIAMIS
ncbi:lipoprotein [Mycoplasma putrefaciens]|uniref:Lipoprotein n=1 Tax=Mycoplasma putrefaciens Mput9231 TaxID=1292033 RepID=M9W9P1_9MOLU|nr:lipoprotein [Mycoplasma putrefaciens]AGJ90723.1 Hypothetical protein, predicted lipoprotein [Mycoplasma putrefaciens Mput9231]